VVNPTGAQIETVITSCDVFVNKVVEGQPVTVVVVIYPAPPDGEVFNDLCVTLTSPLQGIQGAVDTGPWSKGPISTDSNGSATVKFDIFAFPGYWNAGLIFGGQYFANNTIYYQPCRQEIIFHVIEIQTPAPSPTIAVTPSPTATPTSTAVPTLSPTVPEFPYLLVIPLLLSVLAVSVMIRIKLKARNIL